MQVEQQEHALQVRDQVALHERARRPHDGAEQSEQMPRADARSGAHLCANRGHTRISDRRGTARNSQHFNS